MVAGPNPAEVSRSGDELCGDAAAEEASAPRQRQRCGTAPPGQIRETERSHSLDTGGIQRLLEPHQLQWLVQAQAEKHPLTKPDVELEVLGLPRRTHTCLERRDVAANSRRVAPPRLFDCRDRAHAEAEVVMAPPVAEVVARPEVAPARQLLPHAEVRGLVPAVPGAAQRVDHALEIALHRLRLAGELLAVRVREPRSRLRLELVAGEMLRLEREGLVEVALQIGGALARNPVDEVEADVFESGITDNVHGASDVVG